MNEQKAKFTWHYYVMATGALGAMLAATLGSTGGIASGIALAVVSHSALPLKTMTRFAFMLIFVGLYIFSFPDPEVVREMMSDEHVPMQEAAPVESTNTLTDDAPVVAPMTEAVHAPTPAVDTDTK